MNPSADTIPSSAVVAGNGWLAPTVAAVLLVGVAVVGTYRMVHQELTRAALARREAIATLAARVLQEKFDHVADLGMSLASRTLFRQLIREGKWPEAAATFKDIPMRFPFVNRIFLSDPAGTLMQTLPPAPELLGKSFAHRDWYRGVTRAWKPYVSEIYTRSAAPQRQVVSVAVPIQEDDGAPLGIMGLHAQLETFVEWTATLGTEGVVYFVDRNGKSIGDPRASREPTLQDFSQSPAVQRVLKGAHGVIVASDPTGGSEQVISYAPVSPYGWGALTLESSTAAFAARDRSLRFLIGIYSLIGLLGIGFTMVIVRANAERRSAQRLLEARNTQLVEANKALEAFSYSVSHDLRGPLWNIDGCSRILLENHAGTLHAEGRRLLTSVRDKAQRMGQLIDDLLTFSRIGRIPLTASTVNMERLVQDILEELKPALGERTARFNVTPLPDVRGDSAMIRQVLMNLLANAVKFTRPALHADIEVGARTERGQTIYYVKDNGVGFDMQRKHELFRVFQRLHRQEEFEGTGVGLAIVQQVVHRHGGTVWAEGKVNEGATFYFSLPITEGR